MSDRFRRRGAPPPAARPPDPPVPWHARVRREAGEIGRDIAWRLRGALTWSPPALSRSRSLPALLKTLPPDLRQPAESLMSRHAPGWERACDPWGFRESLYVLDLLDRHVGPPSSPLPSLDIGCKNGCYLPGLRAWSGGPWDGVELDAHRRYWTLSTRRAHGEWIARRLPGCRYLAADLLDLRGAYGFVTWFLPFLHEAPLRAWGLPRRFLRPARLLDHARTLLAPGGRLLVVNQGEAEAERQERLFRDASIAASSLGWIESPFSPFRRPRFGWLAILDPSD